jgi:subfamily B ATP-binding cassette protein HlyB/CyaB
MRALKFENGPQFSIRLEENENGPIPVILSHDDVVLLDGTTGCGKSTFLKILRSIYKVSVMELLYRTTPDGELRQLNDGWANLMQQICFCQQSGVAFVKNSLANIVSGTFPGDKYNEEHVKRALELACVPEKIQNRTEDLTPTNVSGGEKQRISLARTVYQLLQEGPNKQIVILDEIDANLDETTSLNIFDTLLKLCQGKLVLIVAHTVAIKKLSQITKALKFQQGAISTIIRPNAPKLETLPLENQSAATPSVEKLN